MDNNSVINISLYITEWNKSAQNDYAVAYNHLTFTFIAKLGVYYYFNSHKSHLPSENIMSLFAVYFVDNDK